MADIATFKNLDVNYSYFVDYIKRLPRFDTLKILDFGCGNGVVVQLLRQEGIECFGVDAFYEGATFEDVQKSDLLQTGVIREIHDNGEIPFPDGYFDVIISNMVLEHVKDKAAVLENLQRVLKPDGVMRHHFPLRDGIRESHIGIPFVHWMRNGRFRYVYTFLLRSIGLGYFKNNYSVRDWAKRQLAWIDKYCYYERHKDMHNLFLKHFIVSYHEIDYCRYRARNKTILHYLLAINKLRPLYQYIFRRLGFLAVELRNPETN